MTEGDYHMAEMLIKSTVTRLRKESKWQDIEDLLVAAFTKLKATPQDLTDVAWCHART